MSCLVGWILTIDGYFELAVESIYNTVIEALSVNPSRKFIAVEMAYFYKWWEIASLPQKLATHRVRALTRHAWWHTHDVMQLVENGQLEFIVGGWTMEDEGCTTYSANIDQMTEGHQLIVSLFGEAAGPKFVVSHKHA